MFEASDVHAAATAHKTAIVLRDERSTTEREKRRMGKRMNNLLADALNGWMDAFISFIHIRCRFENGD